MVWSCKFCTFTSRNRRIFLRHYKIKHGQHGRLCPFPCLYSGCPCSFRSQVGLRNHLISQHETLSNPVSASTRLVCELCNFCEFTNLSKYFAHLGKHTKNKETVNCPFKECSFKSSVYNTFKAHKSKYHCASGLKDLRVELISYMREDSTDSIEAESTGNDLELSLAEESESQDNEDNVKCSLAALLLRMQTVLHVSKSAIQEIVEELYEISVLSQDSAQKLIRNVLEQHDCSPNSTVLTLVSDIIQKTNPFNLLCTTGPLSTNHKRLKYYKEKYTVIDPVEYVLDGARKRNFVYVPILNILSELLNRDEVLENVLQDSSRSRSQTGQYRSFYDSLNYKENQLFVGEEFHIALGLYIDEFEICNPLGTSKNKHKLCGVYWVIANLPIKYRSSLSSIYLATLCYSSDIKTFGYEVILAPLVKDIELLEKQGIYVQKLGASITGTILYVSSDNLGAHSLAGFQESFNIEKYCRFCLASRTDVQKHEVRSEVFPLRTQKDIDSCLSKLQDNEKLGNVDGIKKDCVLNKLSYFETARGFPPDFLHDLLEGIVPVEISICLHAFISSKLFTLDELNSVIQTFPYKFSDKLNRPQKIPLSFHAKGTIGGNGHENWTLLRMLPLMIGHLVPEDHKAWGVLMEVKDIVEILSSSSFTDESLCYLECKISDHRKLLQEFFPDLKLRPKHHYIEHYPHLVKVFGPVLDFWTIRFESKHSFLKKVVRDVNNFKNILLTLASHHQLLLAYHLDMPTIFKPALEVTNVTNVSPDILEFSVKTAVQRKYSGVESVGLASTACLHGTKYSEGMFVSFGQTSGLPDFGKIMKLLIVAQKASFMIEKYTAWYAEHLRCFELCRSLSSDVIIIDPEDLNHYAPLSLYTVQGRHFISPVAFLLH